VKAFSCTTAAQICEKRGGGVSSCEQRSRARSRRGGVSENWIAGSAAASLFFLTAIAIAIALAIATRPFKFHENSVSYTSSSFVSSIHSLALREPEQAIFFGGGDVRRYLPKLRNFVQTSLAIQNLINFFYDCNKLLTSPLQAFLKENQFCSSWNCSICTNLNVLKCCSLEIGNVISFLKDLQQYNNSFERLFIF
jgi:hypothetical protein